MKHIHKIMVLIFLSMTVLCYGQKPLDYLNISDSIMFEDQLYNLVWSSNPNSNYYKQEYLASGDTLDKFNKLITIDLLISEIKPKEAIAVKVSELEQMKKNNPVINYQVFEGKDELMIDFLLSENSPDGEHLLVIERNIYRYRSIEIKKGKKAILLIGVSERAYGWDINRFFSDLQENRFDLINAAKAIQIPTIKIIK